MLSESRFFLKPGVAKGIVRQGFPNSLEFVNVLPLSTEGLRRTDVLQVCKQHCGAAELDGSCFHLRGERESGKEEEKNSPKYT